MKTVIVASENELGNTMKYIKALSKLGTSNKVLKQVAQLAQKSKNPIEYIFDWVYSNVVYFPDPDERQILKPVYKILEMGKGNCTDYSVLLGSLLMLLNIPFSYKTVGYKVPGEYDHIYIVTQNPKTVLDPCIGQKQDGTDTKANRPLKGSFNQETNYLHSKKFPVPTTEILQGSRSRLLRKKSFKIQHQHQLEGLGDFFANLDPTNGNGVVGNFFNNFDKRVISPSIDLLTAPVKVGTGLIYSGGNLVNTAFSAAGNIVSGAGVGAGSYLSDKNTWSTLVPIGAGILGAGALGSAGGLGGLLGNLGGIFGGGSGSATSQNLDQYQVNGLGTKSAGLFDFAGENTIPIILGGGLLLTLLLRGNSNE